MDKIIKNVLKKIENEGFEAYVVGGFVRDYLLNKSSFDIDICTNALPKDLKLFLNINKASNNYGGLNFQIKKYNFDITTYRKEIKYDRRHPIEIKYINNLIEDITRRDFTINTICMDKNGNIIDILHGQKDIQQRVIKSVGDANQKFQEDPLRMFRAIRFATILNFKIDGKTYKAICDNYKLVSTLSSEKIKEELNKILSSSNFAYGLKLLKDTKIALAIGLKYDKIVPTADLIGMYAQISVSKINFSKNEKNNIKKIEQIVNKKVIDNHCLFNNGLYLCLVAGEILGISKKEISKRYKNLPIKSLKEIEFNGNDVMSLLNIKPNNLICEILNDVKNNILNGNLKNRKNEIKKYILRKWQNE